MIGTEKQILEKIDEAKKALTTFNGAGIAGVIGLMHGRPASAHGRSAVTNDPLFLRGVDGRSMVARRYRDVAITLADDLGGQDKLSEPSKILVRQAAALTD